MSSHRLRTRLQKVLGVLLCVTLLLQASPAPLMAYTYAAFSARAPAPQAQSEPRPNEATPEATAQSDGQETNKVFLNTDNSPTISNLPQAEDIPEATPESKSFLPLIANYPPTLPDLPQTQDTQAHEYAAMPAQSQLTAAGDLLLAAGWNLVSLPKVPPDPAPATVLASIASRYAKVYAYDACATADPWKLYDPADPAGSDLTAIDHTMGFWIEMTTAGTLAIAGATTTSTTLTLCPGWNLIGYPLDQAYPVAGILHEIASKYTRVFAWQTSDAADPWKVYDVAVPGWANQVEMMEPGKGYWLYVTEATTLTIRPPVAPPTVSFTGLDDGDEVTSPTPVTGTITSTTPVQWAFEHRFAGQTTWTAFATGDTATSGQIVGSFDPTLLLNGIYEVRLTATDRYGQSAASALVSVVVEGDMKVGIFTISFVDLSIPVAGLSIDVVRTYDSRDKRTGDFGVGWTLSTQDVRVQENGVTGKNWEGKVEYVGGFPTAYCILPARRHIVTITLPDNSVYKFQAAASPQCQRFTPIEYATVVFEPLPGTQGELAPLDGADVVVWGGPSGPVELLDDAEFTPYDANFYQLTLQDGRVLNIDQQMGLQSITDLNGNTLTITPNGISHSAGQSVPFARDGQNRITQITDLMGHTLNYVYDANGDLASVIDQASNMTRFTYNRNHDLIDIIDARGVRAARNEYDAAGRLVAVIDADGRRIELTHNLDEREEVVRDRLGNVTVYVYDERGNVVSQTDALGNTTTFTYDANDNMHSETDPLGRTLTRTYDADDNLLSQTDFDGNTTTFTYNSRGQVLTSTDSRGRTITNTYDPKGNLLENKDGEGAVTKYSYDLSGNLLTVTDPLGHITRQGYDSAGNRTSITDPLGIITNYAYNPNALPTQSSTTGLLNGSAQTLQRGFDYNALGRLTKTVNTLGNEYTVTYNEIGKPTSDRNELGNVVQHEYDTLGQLVRTTYSDGSSETYTHDQAGRLLTRTDRAGNTTTWQYDALGRQTGTVYPDGTTETTVYDATGRVVKVINERGNATTYSYAPNMEMITDTLGNTTKSEFDSDGNLIKLTDANGNVTQYTYDKRSNRHGAGSLVQTTFVDGTAIQFAYDAVGRKTSEIDQAHRETGLGYDAVGHLNRVTDAVGNATQYVYDAFGNLVSYTDANGNTTRFEYDRMGRVTKRVLPLGQAETFAYDAAGNRIAHTDFSGRTTTFAYDNQHRLVRRTLPDGSIENFAYSPEGLRTQAGGDTYTYDARGRLLSETKGTGEVLTYQYDANDNITALTTPQGTVSYTYDLLNRLETVTDYDGGVTRYTYDAVGNISQMALPDDTLTTYAYDTLGRLVQQETKDASNTLVSAYTYMRDLTGRITDVVEGHTGRKVEYSYDALYRLTAEAITESGGATQVISYTYDAVGNRLTKISVEGVTTYTYDANNRLTDEQGPAGAITYSYDANGNLVRKQGPSIDIAYTYDSQHRLITVVEGANQVQYSYDVDGLRVRSVTNGTEITNFLVDKNRPYAQVLLETDGAGSTLANYVYGAALISMAQPASGTSYYHHDAQDSTRQLTNRSGAISDAYSYDAFGNLRASTGTTANTYLYAGEQFDPHTSLYYLRARYYDPSAGRFTTSDSLEIVPTTKPLGLNKYLYADSDPVNKGDPSGHFSFGVALAVSFVLMSTIAIPLSFAGNNSNKTNLTNTQYTKVQVARSFATMMIYREAGWGQDEQTYKIWFGNPPKPNDRNDQERKVRETWARMYDMIVGNELDIKLDSAGECKPGDGGYVTRGTRTINLCPDYFFLWQLAGGPLNIVDNESPAGTIVHEVQHTVGEPPPLGHNKGRSPSNAANLAKYHPDQAIKDAYNYEYCAAENWSVFGEMIYVIMP